MESNDLALARPSIRNYGRSVMSLITLTGFILSCGKQAVQLRKMSPLTERGKAITDGLRTSVPMVYVAPDVSNENSNVCNKAVTALGDGAVVLLDLSESRNSNNSALRGEGLKVQNCLLGGQIEGTYFLVKVSNNVKRILSLESDSLKKSTDLETKLKGWN